MDSSSGSDSDERSQSINENAPLLGRPATPLLDRGLVSPYVFPRVAIFSCAVVCILVTELCERLTFYGINGNLVLFATDDKQLDLTPSEASILSYIFQGTCFSLPVLAGWLADSVAGRFTVIFFSALVYLVGAALLPLGSISEHSHVSWALSSLTLNPTFKKAVYMSGLFLVAFGTGGIKANVSPFGADQVANRGPGAIQTFFIWFYWFINIGAFLAFTFVVYVQQDVSYFYGYLIPACSIIISLLIFLAGKSSYQIRNPTGSVLSTTLKIAMEALRKARRPALSGAFVHHWLDRAKVTFGGSYSSWEVEDVKKVFRLVPIFGTFVLYWTVYAQMSTSMIYQGEYMDIYIGGFQIPIASLSILDTIGVLLLIPIMDKLVYPLLGKCNVHLGQLQRIGIGMIISTASMACAGGIEIYRKDQCCMLQDRGTNHNATNVSTITIFYQVPQYTLIGLSEVFTSVTGLELAYTEAPKSLQGVVMGIFLLTTGLGTYFGAAFVAIVNAISGHYNNKWYPDKDEINQKGNLEYYFFLLAGLMFLNFILYIFVACNFKAKKEAANRSSSMNGHGGVVDSPWIDNGS